jgi:hypothetical protein
VQGLDHLAHPSYITYIYNRAVIADVRKLGSVGGGVTALHVAQTFRVDRNFNVFHAQERNIVKVKRLSRI